MKKLFASLLAVMMLASMLVLPASAAEYDITINGTSTGHTYEAYQVFTGTLADSGILSNIDWGSGVNGGTLLAALKGDASLGSYFTSCTGASDVAEKLALAPFTNLGSVELDAFARIVAQNLTNDSTKIHTSSSSGNTYTISDLAAGYYLIKDKYDDADPELNHDSYTKYMLYVVKDITVSPKAAVPTITKTVSKLENSNYSDSASVTISREAYFRLTGTLHDRITEYDSYKYIFTDTLSEGLTLADKNKDDTVDIKDFTIAVVNPADGTNITVDLTEGKYAGVKPGFAFDESTNIFTITFADVKAFIKAATGSDTVAKDAIQITYMAILDSDAVITDGSESAKTGNVNSATLTYSSDPNRGAVGPTAVTTTATASVFTYALQVNKVDANGTPLPNAQFILYHEPSTSGAATIYGIFEQNGAGVYTLTGFSEDKAQATTLTVNSTETAQKGTLKLYGLGSATFKLEETKAPSDEYNLLQGAASITMPDDRASASTQVLNIVNHKGATLPETGGMGTTLFYVVGVVLMLGAAAVIIAKKRETK